MTFDQFLKNIKPEEEKLSSRIFDLVVGRVLKRVYLGLDRTGGEHMEKTFLSGSDEDREAFIKEHIPNFEKLFEEESVKMEEELKLEIEKEI